MNKVSGNEDKIKDYLRVRIFIYTNKLIINDIF